MTKKVLVSWEQLLELKRYGSVDDLDLTEWFGAQRDVTAVIYSESSAKMA